MAGDNDVTITVDADNRTQAAFGAAARGARTVGEATEQVNRTMREAGQRAETAALRLRQLALQQQEAAERSQRLSTQLTAMRAAAAAAGDTTEATARRIANLTREQEQAAISSRLLTTQHRSATEQVNDLARAYQRAQRNAQEALRASLMFGAGAQLNGDGSVGGADNSPGALRRMLARLPGSLSGLANIGTGAAGAAGSTAGSPAGAIAALGIGVPAVGIGAPMVGGAISGAITAGAAFGGVGLGVAGAMANDPGGFQRQWTAVADAVTERWRKGSAEWVQPAHAALGEVDRMLQDLPIESILKDSMAYLEPLTKAVTGFGGNLGEGLGSLIGDAGPVVDMLSTKLPELGADLGKMFSEIGEGSDGAALALGDLLDGLGFLLQMTGTVLGGLSQMYAATRSLASGFADWYGGLVDGIPLLDQLYESSRRFFEDETTMVGSEIDADHIKDVTEAAYEAANAIGTYADEIDRWRSTAAGAKNAQIALAQGWFDLKEELKDGKKTLDLNTEAGIANQKALVDQLSAAEAARQGQIALNGDMDAANASYNANIERIRQMAYGLGFNKQQVDALISSMQVLGVQAPAPKVTTPGLPQALEQGISLGNALNNINRTYTARVNVQVTGPPQGISIGNLLHHASGGPTSGASVVNDWGPGTGEIIRTPDGSTVIPAGTGRAMLQGLGGGGGGGQRITLEIVSDGGDHGSYLADQLAKTVRVRGGNVQLAITGRSA